MKAKLEAGMTLDFLTREEVREELREFAKAWKQEIARGVRFVKFSVATVRAVPANTWQVGGDTGNNDKDQLGPQPGFLWAVTRIKVSGNAYNTTGDDFQVFIDERTPSKFVDQQFGPGDFYDVPKLVLNGGETLLIRGTATVVATENDVVVAGAAVEVPVQLAHLLVG